MATEAEDFILIILNKKYFINACSVPINYDQPSVHRVFQTIPPTHIVVLLWNDFTLF